MLEPADTNFICKLKSLRYLGVDVFAAESRERMELQRLDLSSNFIEIFHENQFIYLTELSYLNLFNNNIFAIGNDLFRNNTKLKHILLAYNNIDTFEFNLNLLPKLESLILYNNYLPTLKEGVFKSFFVNEKGRENNSARNLDVRLNPFTCNCSMEWMRNIKLKIELKISQNYTCMEYIFRHISLKCFLINMLKTYDINSNSTCINTTFNECVETRRNKLGTYIYI